MDEPSDEVTCRSCFSRFAVDPDRVEVHEGRRYQRCPACYSSMSLPQ